MVDPDRWRPTTTLIIIHIFNQVFSLATRASSMKRPSCNEDNISLSFTEGASLLSLGQTNKKYGNNNLKRVLGLKIKLFSIRPSRLV